MSTTNEHYLTLIKLLLPEELFDYFDLVNLEVKDNQVHAYLEELDIKPIEYKDEKLTSKGFHSPVLIQDFPIRRKSFFLHIRRRRWLIESSGRVVSRDWDTVAKGTRLTKDFATFLKGLFGQLPNQQ
ncbi:MAG: hypothetical protein KAQ75_01180 [Bacteroidales bacterium]|nr:hypothetical protein [Bacteroidales bacterium]